MKIKEFRARTPVTISPEATLQEAARLMDTANVGALLVMDGKQLTGIVTDRDIALRAVSRGLPLDARIDGIMSTNVICVEADADIYDAYELLDKHAVRRLPITENGEIAGMLTTDDLMLLLANDIDRLVRPIVGEIAFGHHPTPVPAVS